ncbi:hypothetical protein ONE63_006521 [Megalurothrips usitatus]|uniref:Helicase POLQ-like n=1 Tax=Megalurothrips usitatus TaxID=439358 RepID=A0AAV7XUN3_9NEOP|nr:hypothetical protein ONE63_006521 [Megalurothrips usitatus]
MLRSRSLSLNRSLSLSKRRKHDNGETSSSPATCDTVQNLALEKTADDTLGNCLAIIEAAEQAASENEALCKGYPHVQGLSPIPNLSCPLTVGSPSSPLINKSSGVAQRRLIDCEKLPDESLTDIELLALPDPPCETDIKEEDLFENEPSVCANALSDSGCEGASIDDEEEKQWEDSVYVKSPAPANISSRRISNSTRVTDSSTVGIQQLSCPSNSHNGSKAEANLQGLCDINWDESLRFGDKSRVLDTSPCSLPFSQQIRQQLLNNNNKTGTVTPPCALGKQTTDDCSFFGLPLKVQALIEKFRGIKELYDWQKECLLMPEVQQRQNLVYALPTSGGKTLVAEILLLKEILINRKNTLFVLPYVSIVQEKVRAISQLAVELDFFVEEYAAGKGPYPPKKRRCKNAVYIATIEKALGLVHSLINESRLHEIGLVVIDELHLVGEGSRGATLESVLTNLRNCKADIQIVGMSATIGNLGEVASFLDAKTYTGDFRPVELKEYIKCDQTIYSIHRNLIGSNDSPLQIERTLESKYSEEQLQTDPDQIGTLVAEVVPDDSCLVFCPSRKNCENVALLICQTMPKDLMNVRVEEKRALYKALAAEGNGQVCPILIKTLPYGIAYHHSGLTIAERRLLEEAFLAKTVCVICCTSTLAAGVNLPARRVILRSPYIGKDFIDLSRYKQMVGRAGRAGFGGVGESILMCLFKDTHKVLELLSSNMTETNSYLAADDGAGLKALILHSVSLRLASSRLDIHTFLKKTLLWVQAEKQGIDVLKAADGCVQSLVSEGGFTVSKETCSSENSTDLVTAEICGKEKSNTIVYISLSTPLNLSRIGEAAVKGSFNMVTAHRLYDDLHLAQEKLVLLNHLHLLYIVTPYNMVDQVKYLNQVYFNVYMDLGEEELKVASALGITEAVAVSVMKRKSIKTVPQVVVDRFFVTLMLYDLWNQKTVWDVSNKYQVSRGIVFSLLQAASGFASCVLRFCEVLEEFWCFKVLLEEIVQRLTHCCAVELLPLMELPAVKIGRARQLYNAGYRSLRDVASADPVSLIKQLDHMPRKTAYQIVAAAKLLLIQKAESLKDEASEYLDGITFHIKETVTPRL